MSGMLKVALVLPFAQDRLETDEEAEGTLSKWNQRDAFRSTACAMDPVAVLLYAKWLHSLKRFLWKNRFKKGCGWSLNVSVNVTLQKTSQNLASFRSHDRHFEEYRMKKVLPFFPLSHLLVLAPFITFDFLCFRATVQDFRHRITFRPVETISATIFQHHS